MSYQFVNWGKTASATARVYQQPGSEDEVIEAVRAAQKRGGRVRVVGAGHSWSDCAADTDVLLNLDRLNTVLAIDREAMTVTAEAGIRLKHLVVELERAGLALKNLGSVMEQSIAGAISTGTHGSGLAFGNLATQLTAFRLVTAAGEAVDVSRTRDPELFCAAAISFGALGILTQVTLSVEPSYDLIETSFSMPFDAALQLAPTFYENHPRVKLWWLPHTDSVQVFTYDKTHLDRTPRSRLADRLDTFVNDHVFDLALRLGERVPSLVSSLNKAIGAAYFKPSTRVDRYENLLTLAMPPVHREAEFGVPVDRTTDILRETRAIIRRHGHAVGFINEVRFVQNDDLWLSGAYGRDSCQFGAYTNDTPGAQDFMHRVGYAAYEMGGRPHWGKEFDVEADYLATAYPRFDEFAKLRKRLDPQGIFANAFVRRIFDLP